jgi:formate hydrogenlyase subunit 6/NADH:ubiquinone oxidoreductase subunit I
MYYCESCQEVCCEFCLNEGPHNNELHRVDYFLVYYKKRVDYL